MEMYASFYAKDDEDDKCLKEEQFKIEGDDNMRLGEVIRQLYYKFDVVDYVSYSTVVELTDLMDRPLNKFFSKHMQFSFNTSKYWVAVHFE